MSIETAMQIQARGFDILRSGTGAGNLLGKSIYCTTVLDKASKYAKGKACGGVILRLRCKLGNCE